MNYDLRPYQYQAVKRLLDCRRIINADAMSMGKSLETLAAKPLIDEEIGERPMLIFCPPAVIPHWENESRKWHYKERSTRITRLSTLSNLKSDLRGASDAEIVIGGYPLLSDIGKHPEAVELFKPFNFGFGVLDEGQAMSKPHSYRTKASRMLFGNIPFLSILSGTPIPNTLVDIYSQLNLLDSAAFPLEDDNSDAVLYDFYQIIRTKPHLVRDILHSRMIRRTPEEYLGKKMPVLEQRVIPVTLTGEHEQVYFELYENDNIPVSFKLPELLKVSLDPNLATPHWLPESLQQRLGKMRSCTYDTLDEVVKLAIEKEGGKVLYFTDLKKKVIPALIERYARYGALAMTHEVSPHASEGEESNREKMRKQFQFNPAYRFMASTNVMDVGIDGSAATYVVQGTLPYMPATLDQRISRSQRVTAEIEKDKVVSVILNPRLSNGAPTITEGLMQLLDDKRRIISYILESPEKLTLDDLELIKDGHPERSAPLARFLSPKSFMDFHWGSLRCMGGKNIAAEYRKHPDWQQDIVKSYLKYWDGYYGGNANTLTASLIRTLIPITPETSIVDICSGPFSLSRRLEIPVMNLDLNPYMLAAGKILEEQGAVPLGNKAYEGFAHDLPFKQNQFVLANCSLALHMSSLDELAEGRSEREIILREAYRVAQRYFTFTLPHTVIHRRDVPSLTEGLHQIGWEVLPQTGFYHGAGDSKFRVFLGVLEKQEENSPDPVSTDMLSWRIDAKLEGKKRKRKSTNSHKIFVPRKKREQFELVPEFVHEESLSRIEAGGQA